MRRDLCDYAGDGANFFRFVAERFYRLPNNRKFFHCLIQILTGILYIPKSFINIVHGLHQMIIILDLILYYNFQRAHIFMQEAGDGAGIFGAVRGADGYFVDDVYDVLRSIAHLFRQVVEV